MARYIPNRNVYILVCPLKHTFKNVSVILLVMGKNWKWSQLFSTPGRTECGVFRDGTTIICDPTHVPNNIDRSHHLNAEPNTKCVLYDSLYIMCRMAKLTHDDRGQGWSHLGDVELVPGRWREGGSGERGVFLVIWVLTSWVYSICERNHWAPGWLWFFTIASSRKNF